MTLADRRLLVACGVSVVLVMPAALRAQESLAAARELYASAEYNSALAMLSGLLSANPSPQERQSIELYRVFCLFAVNNVEEANSALEAMIVRDPIFRPKEDEVPRRLRPAFSDARRRLLPSIIEKKYTAAKAAFDKGDFKAASEGFTEALTALADPDIAALVQQHPLSDLKTLAAGFNDLAVRALAPPPAPKPAEPEPAAAAETMVVRTPRIYGIDDPGVTMPVVVRQTLPPFQGPVFSQRQGTLDVIIDETGAVESATMVTPVDPRYNAMVLAAAKTWQYEPARVGGAPVKFRKRIQITLTANR